MIRDLGIVQPGTTLYIPFHTFDSNDPSASVTMTGLATTDIEILSSTFSFRSNPRPNCSTFSAVPRSVRRIHVCIGLAVGVSLRTVRFGFLLFATFLARLAASQVDPVGDWLKVVWANTRRIAAQMVQFLAIRNRPFEERIAESMGVNDLVANTNDAVSACRFGGSPNPTSFGFLNLRPKTILNRLRGSSELPGNKVMEHMR